MLKKDTSWATISSTPLLSKVYSVYFFFLIHFFKSCKESVPDDKLKLQVQGTRPLAF
jgi:hypothetical protein